MTRYRTTRPLWEDVAGWGAISIAAVLIAVLFFI